jgi:hypothetical protein
MRIRLQLLAKASLVMGIATWCLGWALERYEIWVPTSSIYWHLTEYPYLWISGWIILVAVVSLAVSAILYVVGEKMELDEIIATEGSSTQEGI